MKRSGLFFFLGILCGLLLSAFGIALLLASDDSGESLTIGSGPDITPEVQTKVAIHEAGHAVVGAYLYGDDYVLYLGVNEKVDEGVYGATGFKNPAQLGDASDLRRDVIVSMAGRAGDVIVGRGPNVGASGDLEEANDRLNAMYGIAGLGGSFLVRDPKQLPPAMLAAIEAELVAANACAEAIVMANAETVQAVADALLASGEGDSEINMDRETFVKLMHQLGVRQPDPPVQLLLMTECVPHAQWQTR